MKAKNDGLSFVSKLGIVFFLLNMGPFYPAIVFFIYLEAYLELD